MSGYKDGPVNEAQFTELQGKTIYNDVIYVTEYTRIRKIENGIVSTVIGGASGNDDVLLQPNLIIFVESVSI